MDFKGKIVLITGASSGIGAETAKLFSKLGATVVLTGRNKKNLTEVQKECVGPSQVIVADLAKEEDVARIFRETLSTQKRLDVLVNNAGFIKADGITDPSLATFDALFQVNVRAVYQLTSLFVGTLVLNKGCIVNVSSVTGLRSFSNILSYCMSKSALDQFTRCTALELAPKGVRVNSVNPAVIVTGLHTTMGMNEEEYRKFLERGKETHPLGRVGTPDEVAGAIAFLASDYASNITGTTLPVDGGKNVLCPR